MEVHNRKLLMVILLVSSVLCDQILCDTVRCGTEFRAAVRTVCMSKRGYGRNILENALLAADYQNGFRTGGRQKSRSQSFPRLKKPASSYSGPHDFCCTYGCSDAFIRSAVC